MARVVSAAPIVAALYRQLRDDEEAFAAQVAQDRRDGVHAVTAPGGRCVLREHEIRLAQLRAGYPVEVPGSLIPPSSLPAAGAGRVVVYPDGRVESVNRKVGPDEFLFAFMAEGDGSVTSFVDWLHQEYYAR